MGECERDAVASRKLADQFLDRRDQAEVIERRGMQAV